MFCLLAKIDRWCNCTKFISINYTKILSIYIKFENNYQWTI